MKVITIGRSTDNNNIVINDSKVSRSHLQIINDANGDFYAIDLDSTNGTFVNGTRISGKVQLHKGDIVVIGNTTLSWEKYFNPKSEPKLGDDKEDKNTKSLNKRLYIIISSILICALIGVIAIIVNNKKNEQDIEASYNEVTRAYTEEAIKANEAKETAEKEAKDARDAAEKAKENEKAAKIAQTEAEANEQKAKDAQKEAEMKEQVANAAKEEAEKGAKAAQNAAEKAKKNEEAAKNAQKTAENKAKAAQVAAEEAKKTTELTKEFYQLLSKMKDAQIVTVCKNIGLKTHTEDKLINDFNSEKTTNEEREKIIKTIKDVLNPSTPAASNLQKTDSASNGK